MTVLIAAAIWAALIGVAILRRHSPTDRSTIYLGMAVGFGLLLNIDLVYLAVDATLGGENYADLLANTAIIVGFSSFARGIAKAANVSSPVAKIMLGPYVLVAVMILSAAAFSMIETSGSSTRFMADYGDQPAAAAYSIVQHLYFGTVTLAMAVVCIGQRAQARGFMLAAINVLLIGSLGQTLTCIDVIVMDIAHLAGNEDLLGIGQSIYDYCNGLSIMLIAAGFVMIPTARIRAARRTDKQIARLINDLHPAWSRAAEARSSRLSLQPAGDQESVLYRQLIEIRDAQASLGSQFELSATEVAQLDVAEAILLDRSPAVLRHEK